MVSLFNRNPRDLAVDDPRAGGEKSEVRSAVVRFIAVSLIALVIVALPVTLWIRAEAEGYALSTATHITERLAEYSLRPLLTEGLIVGDPASLAPLDERLVPWMSDGAIVRIKIWDADGKVIYSDYHELIGEKWQLPPWGRKILAGGEGKATFEAGVESDYEERLGSEQLVEVYVGASASNGAPLIFEAYFDKAIVHDEQATVLLGMTPVFLISLAVLQLAQLIPAVNLAKRMQRQHATRRTLLQHAIDASDIERTRIARVLHDEVIQDLSGLSYAVEAEEIRAAAEQRPLLTRAREILQRDLRQLRSITTELYPPELELGGLPNALSVLAERLDLQGLEVKLDIAEGFDLDRDHSATLFRVAREVLGNALKHANARRISLDLTQVGDITTMRIEDDGSGFDSSAEFQDGHFGLRIIRDTMRVATGALVVSSRPGHGTIVVAELGRVSERPPGLRLRRQRRARIW